MSSEGYRFGRNLPAATSVVLAVAFVMAVPSEMRSQDWCWSRVDNTTAVAARRLTLGTWLGLAGNAIVRPERLEDREIVDAYPAGEVLGNGEPVVQGRDRWIAIMSDTNGGAPWKALPIHLQRSTDGNCVDDEVDFVAIIGVDDDVLPSGLLRMESQRFVIEGARPLVR